MIVVYYNEPAHKQAIAAQKDKKKLFETLLTAANEFVKIAAKDEALFKKNPFKYFENAIMQKYEAQNTLRLSFPKLVELLELKIDNVKALCDKYASMHAIDENKAIKESDYQIIASTPEQIERYNDAKNLVDALINIKAKYRQALGFLSFQSATLNILRFQFEDNTIIPNPDFVMKGH